MKRCIILLTLSGCLTAAGQNFKPLAAEEAKDMLVKIESASRAMESFECSFTETKNISVLNEKQHSEGKMYYKDGNKLRWEYTSPSSFIFVCDGDRTVVNNGASVERGNSGINMVFREIGRTVLACINGRQLADPAKYTAAYYTDGSRIKVSLTPRNRRTLQMMGSMSLVFGLKDYMIQTIIISNGGDESVIELRDKKVNRPIDDSVFVL